MKKLLGIVVLGLLLITPSQADDIRDFQIEGMSIGDSLLDYFSGEEIQKKKIKFTFKNFFTSEFTKKKDNLKIYDALHIHYKNNDKDFIIQQVEGIIDFVNKNNVAESYGNPIYENDCLIKQREISSYVFSTVIDNPDIMKFSNKKNKKQDKTGKSYGVYTTIMSNEGDLILVECNVWSKKMKFINHVRVRIVSKNYK